MKRHTLFFTFVTLSFFATAQTNLSAKEMLQDAYKKAAVEKKNVMVIFHASWCGWCHKMDSSMNDATTKKFFSDNYVTIHFTVFESPENKKMETPGAAEFNKLYKGDKAGLPFWLVMDSKGNLLADSFIRPAGGSLQISGDNIGCPSEPKEVDAFIKILKATSKLSVQELAVIAKRFNKNRAH